MRKHNNFYIIGVDAGYGNMKTARTIYPTGLVAMDTKPFFDGDILEYNNTWYRIGEGHKAYNPDKTADEDFYILTLASIAAELSTEQITEANVYLALGLPTTWTGRQREEYRRYMMRNPDVRFAFNDVLYSIHLTDCIVFPQGYAALVPLMRMATASLPGRKAAGKHERFVQLTGTTVAMRNAGAPLLPMPSMKPCVKLDSRRALLILGAMQIRVCSAFLWYTKGRMPARWRNAASPQRLAKRTGRSASRIN